jgi:prophage regulatory protein
LKIEPSPTGARNPHRSSTIFGSLEKNPETLINPNADCYKAISGEKTASSQAPGDAMNKPITYLKVNQVATRMTVSDATIWRWTAAGCFPAPVKIGPGSTRWRLGDIEEWEQTQHVGLVTTLEFAPHFFRAA